MIILQNLQITITLLIVLSILVIAHEWGHFIVARLFGIRVDDFSIGFGKRLVRLGKRGDTEYNLRMLPLGGFVKIAGMAADEEPLVRAKDKIVGKGDSTDPDADELPLVAENMDTEGSDTAAEPGPDEFGSKPLWQRSLVILAGPVMSLLLGYVILCGIGMTIGWPTGKLSNTVDMVYAGGEGQKIGLRGGDKIVGINGTPITSGHQMVSMIMDNPGKPLKLAVKRDGKLLSLTATPRPALDEHKKPVLDLDIQSPGKLGQAFDVRPGDNLSGMDNTVFHTRADALNALTNAAGKNVTLVVMRDLQAIPLDGTIPKDIAQGLPTIKAHPIGQLKFDPQTSLERTGMRKSIADGNRAMVNIFTAFGQLLQQHKLKESAGGIIMMYQATGLAVQNDALKPSNLYKTISLMAQLSLSLGIFNLLPIPILDGGHLLSFFIEWIRRGKKMTEQQQQAFLMTGLAIIGVLFVLIMTNDILRTVHHQLPQ